MFGWVKYKVAYWRWFWSDRTPLGDPILGKTREERNKNIRLMSERWYAREPKREDFD